MSKSKKRDKRRLKPKNPVAQELPKFKGRRFDKRDLALRRLQEPTFVSITRFSSEYDSRK
jgi:hypothetical protein